MSIRWISKVWQSSPYEGKRLLLHLALADFANDEGECFPSIKTLAKKARSSSQWIRVGLREMEQDGMVEIVERGLGRGNVNRYRLLPIRNGASGLPIPRDREEATESSNRATESLESGNSVTSPSIYKNRHEPSEPSLDLHPAFEAFWSAYPRKIGKGSARKAFMKAMRGSDAPTMPSLLEAVDRYRASVSDPRYIAHASTWLNGDRWLDEIDDAKTATVGSYSPDEFIAISHASPYVAAGYTLDELIESFPTEFTNVQREIAISHYKERRIK